MWSDEVAREARATFWFSRRDALKRGQAFGSACFRFAARSSWLQFLARTRGMAVYIGFERKKITAVTRLIRRIAVEPWRIYWLAVSVVTDRALQVAARRDVVFFRLIDIPRC